MKNLGELSWRIRSYITSFCDDRLISFAWTDKGKLLVSEFFLGEKVERRTVSKNVGCQAGTLGRICC